MKTRYKILTVAVMFSLILSIVCVNASAFERETYQDITGDFDEYAETKYPFSIFGDGYALINCGDICKNYGWGGDPGSPYIPIGQLNNFLYEEAHDHFVSPSGLYDSSDYGTLNYLEFFIRDLSSDKLYSKGIYPVGIESDLILNYEIYVREVSPREEYHFQFSSFLADSCYFSAAHYALIVACYFDDCTPYDDINDAPSLIKYYYDFDQQLESAQDYAAELTAENEGLYDQIYLLESDISSLQADVISYAQKYYGVLSDYENLIVERDAIIGERDAFEFLYNKLLYEEKNYDFIGLIFTGPAAAIVNSIQDLSGLGFDYNHDNVNDLTIGGLFVVALLGAFIIFLLRLAFGKGGSSS